MKIQLMVCSIALAASTLAMAEEIKMMHLQMGGSYNQYFAQELSARPTAQGQAVKVTLIPTPASPGNNPFHFTSKNWDFGNVFFEAGKDSVDEMPFAAPADLDWFRNARLSGNQPEMMVISGHHIPGVGWHNDSKEGDYYTRNLTLASLLNLREQNAEARAFFDNVKFVFISGCWGLSNMEAHLDNGQMLTQEQANEIYLSGKAGQDKVHGTPKEFYSLEAQRWELYTLYGGDFASNPQDEICEGNKCATYNVHRILSDKGLLDGSHRFNQPLNLRKLFPNAAVVFGFHSPSPFADKVKSMMSAAFDRTRKSLGSEDQTYARNLMQSIISDQTPVDVKKRLVQSFREAWTTITWEQNYGAMPKYSGGRPGASISPAFPELDNDGPFAWPKNYKNPSFAPKCNHYRPDANPC